MLARGRLVSLAIGLLALLLSSGCGAGGDEAERLLVVNHNILHGIMDEDPAAAPFDRFPERLPLIADALAEAQPDIVLLQEVVSNPGPDYPNVRDTVLAALGEQHRALLGNFLGDPIDTEGLGQMTLPRLPVLSSQNKSVSAIRSAVRVTVQTDSGPLSIYNVHLEGTGAVLETGESAELLEIENVIAFIRETRSGAGAVILAGDFNTEPEDPSVQALLDPRFIYPPAPP